MSEELKACPFCGARGVEYHTDSGKILAGCDAECQGFGFPVYPSIWNTRPIEDTLEAENAALKEEVAKLKSEAVLVEAYLDNHHKDLLEINRVQVEISAMLDKIKKNLEPPRR